MQAFATRTSPPQRTAPDHQNLQPSTQNVILRKCRPSQREGLPTKDPCTTHRSGWPRLSRSFTHEGAPSKLGLGGGFPRLSALHFPTLTSKNTTLGWATRAKRWASPPCPRYCPLKPRFTNTFTSTRRFSALPWEVSLGADGSTVPMAPGATICRTGTLQSWTK